MLKGIPAIISPELLKVIMEMGHGDEIVFGDGNFPAASCAQRLIRADGHGVPELLRAVLKFFPIDTFAESPVALMQVVGKDEPRPPIWATYERIITENSDGEVAIDLVERFQFYERARKAYAIVATGEPALYANIILKKGVVPPA